jgi:BirA family transcriptional regulator, biotin operon repressor / biotin---[acetyl-CoA-carboxylase] ligase
MRIYLYDRITSTSDVLKEKAMAGEPEGSVVVAECQTNGRGRYGRTWLSLPGKGLYCSLILRPTPAHCHPALLSLSTSVAIVDTLNRECGLNAQVKWPNDVFIGGLKIAGVLVETHFQDHNLVFVIVGIGLNLYYTGEELRNHGLAAASLLNLSKKAINKDRILERLLKEIFNNYHLIKNQEQQQRLCEKWARYCMNLSKPVTVRNHGESITGIFNGVDVSGAALIELSTGEIALVNSGEFSMGEEACF